MARAADQDTTRIRVRTLGAILEHACTLSGQPAAEPADPYATPRWEEDPPVTSVPWIPSQARSVGIVRRGDLAWGDTLYVVTKNSTYCINAADHGWLVWGGWFERHGHAPATVGINGCTWGGSVIHADVLAAPGLFLEFANGVTTTRIRSVLVVPAGCSAGFLG